MHLQRFDFRRVPGAAYVLVAQIVLFGLIDRRFLSIDNFQNVAYQMSPLLVVSVGMTFVILSEGIDLSQGGVVGLAGVVSAMLLVSGLGLVPSVLMGLLAGSLMGLLTGLVISLGAVPPFVATLGTLGISQGLALGLSQGSSIAGLDETFQFFGQGSWILPIPTWVALGVLLLFWGILRLTPFGTYVYSMGGNRDAMRYAGINVKGHLIWVYIISGLCSGIAALLMAAHDNAAHPRAAVGIEFDAIAAVILGGTSFEKGRGTMLGSVAGALTIAFLRNGLNFSGMPTTWQLPVVGMVIIVAIMVNEMMQRSLAREMA